MKKLLALLLALLMALGLVFAVGCGDDDEGSSKKKSKDDKSTSQTADDDVDLADIIVGKWQLKGDIEGDKLLELVKTVLSSDPELSEQIGAIFEKVPNSVLEKFMKRYLEALFFEFDEDETVSYAVDRDVLEDAMKTFIKDFVKVMSKGDYDDLAEMLGVSAAEAEANIKAAGFDTLNEFWEYVGKTAIKSFSAETIAEQIEEKEDDYSISGNRLRFGVKDGNVTELKVSCQKNKIVVKKVTFKSDSDDEESAEGIAALMFEGMTFVKVSG